MESAEWKSRISGLFWTFEFQGSTRNYHKEENSVCWPVPLQYPRPIPLKDWSATTFFYVQWKSHPNVNPISKNLTKSPFSSICMTITLPVQTWCPFCYREKFIMKLITSHAHEQICRPFIFQQYHLLECWDNGEGSWLFDILFTWNWIGYKLFLVFLSFLKLLKIFLVFELFEDFRALSSFFQIFSSFFRFLKIFKDFWGFFEKSVGFSAFWVF